MEILFADFTAAVDAVLTTPVCSQCWLGYGDVLFLGFGDFLLPEDPQDEALNHPKPQNELQTNFSDWQVTVQGKIVASSYDDPEAEANAQVLVGKTLQRWTGSASREAAFYFSDDTMLTFIASPSCQEDEFRTSDAWAVRDATGTYCILRCDGTTFRQRGDTQTTA